MTDHDLNFCINLSKDQDLNFALNELVANAFDAHPGVMPTISCQSETLKIQNGGGTGITRDSFRMGASKNKPGSFGRFGQGLKDAVAICLRHKIQVVIDSVNKRLTLHADPKGNVFLKEEDRLCANTVVHLVFPGSGGAKQAEATIKKNFIQFNADVQPLKAVGIDVYPSVGSGIFVRGMRFESPWPQRLTYSYNITDKTLGEEIIKEAGRDHKIPSSFNKKPIRELIWKGFQALRVGEPSDGTVEQDICDKKMLASCPPPQQTLLTRPPPSVAPLASVPPAAPQITAAAPVVTPLALPHAKNLTESLLRHLVYASMEQNHPWLTVLPDEQAHLSCVYEEIMSMVQKEAGPYEVHLCGSAEKLTAIPGQLDLDINFKITKANNTPAVRAKIIEKILSAGGLRMASARPDGAVTTVSYKGVEVDLVFVEDGDPRAPEDALPNVKEVKAAVECPDKQKLLTFVRACKYWVKRNSVKGETLKSFYMEELAIIAYKAYSGDSESVFVARFRRFFEAVRAIDPNSGTEAQKRIKEGPVAEYKVKAAEALTYLRLI